MSRPARVRPASIAGLASILLVGGMLPSYAAGGRGPRFAAARGYVVPIIPMAVAIVDMTGDGLPDIVSASQDNIISLLRNKGRRTFARALNVPTSVQGDLLGDAVVSDLNADGFPDVAATSENPGSGLGTVAVLINNAGHGFLSPVLYPQPKGVGSLAVGDVDGDGDPDLAITEANVNGSNPIIGIMANAGDGTFGSPVPHSAPNANGPCFLVDVNGDGALDVVVLDEIHAVVAVLIGDGHGNFGTEASFATDVTFPLSLAVGDINNDGRPDVVVGGETGEGSLLINQGDGTFGTPTSVELGAGGSEAFVTLADFQGDGNLDIAAASYSGWVTPVLGKGDGTFRLGTRFEAGAGPEAIAGGDLDRDGRQDLAVAGNLGTIAPLFGSGGGTFQAASVAFLSGAAVVAGAFEATDLNGDGLPDLAIGAGTDAEGRSGGRSFPLPSVAISLNQGQAQFGPVAPYPVPWDPTGLAVGDLNGDGILDLIVSLADNDTQNVAVLLGTGNGAFGTPSLLSVANFPVGIAVGDFTGDGLLDLGIAISDSAMQTAEVTVLPGAGDGTFGAGVTTSLVGGEALAISAVHLDSNPTLDVAVLTHKTDGTDRAFAVAALGTGTGGFSNIQQYAVGHGTGELATSDLNGDGVTDLITSAPTTNDLHPLLGVGDGTFDAEPAVRVGTAPHWLAVADFTKDGVPDVTVADEYGLLWAMPGLGDGTFGPAASYASSLDPVAAADLNGDGALDIAQGQGLVIGLYFGLTH